MQVVSSPKQTTAKPLTLTTNLEESTLVRLLVVYGTHTLHFEFINDAEETEEASISTTEFILSELSEDNIEFTHPIYSKVYDEIVTYINENNAVPNQKFFIHHHNPDITEAVSELLSEKHQLSDWAKKEIFVPTETEKLKEIVVEAVVRFKSKQVKLKIDEMLQQMKSNDLSEQDRLNFMGNFQKLNELSKFIDKELGREC
jgi:DNA primase